MLQGSALPVHSRAFEQESTYALGIAIHSQVTNLKLSHRSYGLLGQSFRGSDAVPGGREWSSQLLPPVDFLEPPPPIFL